MFKKPHQKTNESLKRWLLTALLAVFLLPQVLTSLAPQPVQARTVEDAFQSDLNPPTQFDQVRDYLIEIQDKQEACRAFFGQNNAACDGEGKPGDLKLPTRVIDPDGQKYGEGPNGLPEKSRFSKLSGKNPYLIVSAQDDSDLKLPAGMDPNKIRFVLTKIENVSTDDLSPGQDEGNVYIFQNEFNPNLAIAILAPVGGALSSDIPEKMNFVFFPGSQCRGAMGEEYEVSGIDFVDGGTSGTPLVENILSNAEDKENLEKDTEENGFVLTVPICDTNGNAFAEAMRNAIASVAEALSALMDTITGWLSDLVDVGTIAEVPGLTNAWKTIRDLVNIIFILILAVVAFSNILRIDTDRYGVRALLPRVIFAVIAVNFSLVMLQVLTNVAFVLSQPFLQVSRALITNPPIDGSLIDPEAGIGAAIVAVLVLIVVIIAMLVLAFFFLVRIIVIWLLAALSPFVFLFMILPTTRSLASMWWKNAMKWIFMAPIAFVILYIAASIISGGRNEAVGTQDPGFILKIGFFAGALIAAVIIPLKLGGEVMGRAVSGAKKAPGFGKSVASKLPGAGTAAAYRDQRQANKEQGAKLRAAAIQGKVSSGLSRFPGGRSAAAALTGGRAGMIGSQQAAIEGKYAKDIDDMGLNSSAQKMIAAGDTKGLRKDGLHRAANLANTGAGRRAAGKLLAQKGLLTASALDDMPAGRRKEQIAAGNQAYMKSADPVLAARNTEGVITDKAITGIGAHVGSSDPGHTKEMYWGEMEKSLHSVDPQERKAAEKAFSSISSVNAKDNVDHGNRRNLISDDADRASYVRGIRTHGSAAAKSALNQQLSQNIREHGVGNAGVGGPTSNTNSLPFGHPDIDSQRDDNGM